MREPLPEITVWHWPQDGAFARQVARILNDHRMSEFFRVSEADLPPEAKTAEAAAASFPPGALLITRAPLEET